MEKFIKIIVSLVFVISVFFAGKVRSQEQKINFKHYSINNGLSQNTVLSLLEDKYGIIWIGTEDGLNKFDGYEFTIYKNDISDSSSISNNQINALYEDFDGNIWIATSKGLNLFERKTGTFRRVLLNSAKVEGVGDYFTSIYQDKHGILWLGTLEDLKRFDPKTNKTETFKPEPGKAPEFNRVMFIYQDTDRSLWLSLERGFRRFDPIRRKFIPLPALLESNDSFKKSFVRSIKSDSKGRLWIASEYNGIYIYDKANNSIEHLKHEPGNFNSLPSDKVKEIHICRDDIVWIGTREGLSIYDPNTKQIRTYTHNIYNPESLSGNIIRALLRDRAGNFWIGTYASGLNLVTPSNNMFSNIGQRVGTVPGLSASIIGAIVDGDENSLWVGLESAGLNYVDRSHNKFVAFDLEEKSNGLSSNTVKSLLKDGDKLWIGTLNALLSLDTKTKRFKLCPTPDNKGVYSLEKNKYGIWVATNGGGLMLIKPDGRRVYYKHDVTNKSSICSNSINKILVDRLGNLWISTGRGLDYFDGEKFIHHIHDPSNPFSLSYSSINSLFFDSRQRLWIGTKGGGLNVYDSRTKRFYYISSKDGLSSDVIQAIQEDRSGNLWISSNKGLSKITFTRFKFPLDKSHYNISNYFFEDGLQSNQFLQNCSTTDRDGKLYFGGINGVTFFAPSKIRINQHKPTVVFTDFLIKNKSVNINDEDSPLKTSINETSALTLENDQAFITIKFAALDFQNPQKNQYLYRLEGLKNNDDWHLDIGKGQRMATYTNLDAGVYYFRVKASNNDGVWNDVPKTLKIIVLPPWWKSLWALLLYALFFAFLLYLYYFYSFKTAQLKNQLHYEHLIREKDQELYHKKLNFFTNISHEIKTPLTLILAPLEKLIEANEGNNKTMHQLTLMKRSGERLLRLINQLLDFRKFESGNMELQAAEGNIVQFVKEVVYAFQPYAKHLNINIKVEAQRSSIKLWFDRDKFEKILYNLLSNALKFTRIDGEVIVRIREIEEIINKLSSPHFVVIEVIDNGIGIPEGYIEEIFSQFKHYNESGLNENGSGIGLTFTKGLVELHRGEISVESIESKNGTNGYTCFSVKIPQGKAHLKENEILANYKSSENIEGYLDLQVVTESNLIADTRAQRVIEQNDGEKPILLIVEDNKDVMDFLVSHFEDRFEVSKAFNGSDGLEKAFELIPDIVISDVMMPVMSGTALCSALKNDNRTSHIPVILLTARAPLIYKIEGLETGADDYITKPFSIQVLEARVWNLLETRQKLRERYKKEITLQPRNIAITSPDEVFLDKVMNFIEAHISDPDLSVEELGKEVYMTRITLYRKIKALTNQTTVEFIRTVRLKRAAQLLSTQKYNVSEVAFMVGFIDLNYFRRCFKKEFNKSPKEYGAKDE